MKLPLEPLWRLVYPEQCAVCGERLGLDRRHLCARCHERLPRIGPHACPRCGEALAPHSNTAGGCVACRGRRFAFRRAAAPFRYEGAIRDLLLEFKLGRRASLAHVLADLLCDYLEEGGLGHSVDLIVPVPLHWLRRLSRGFNQSGLLALGVAARFRLPVSTTALCRRRPTRSQTQFTSLRRRANVRDAFRVRANGGGPVGRLLARLLRRADVEGKRVLLIDDILTTGSTAHECARALRKAGAKEVVVAAVAR